MPVCSTNRCRKRPGERNASVATSSSASGRSRCAHLRGALPPDSGRVLGVRQALTSEFNCTSRYSDAKPEDCDELRFAVTDGEALVRAYKTPSLRGVAGRAPYMHAGQLATLADVVAHYDRAPAAPSGHSELEPLRLTADERRQLEAFLRTLSSPLSAPAGFLAAPNVAAR